MENYLGSTKNSNKNKAYFLKAVFQKKILENYLSLMRCIFYKYYLCL